MNPTDDSALKSRVLWGLRHFGDLVAVAVTIVAVGLVLLFLVARLREVTRNAQEITRLQVEVKNMQEQLKSQDELLSSWLLELEAQLYKESAKAEPSAQRPTREPWVATRDAELRRRLLSLERWRLEQMK